MNTKTNLLIAEMDRVKELITEIDEIVVPEYIEKGGYEVNHGYWASRSKKKQLESELKQRLTMVRKDAIILRKQLEDK